MQSREALISRSLAPIHPSPESKEKPLHPYHQEQDILLQLRLHNPQEVSLL